MRLKLKFLVISVSLIIFNSCIKPGDNGGVTGGLSSQLNKILPLGTSRVAGNRPVYESYRYDLWKSLIDGNWSFDYVGSQIDVASYPFYKTVSFDIDHEE